MIGLSGVADGGDGAEQATARRAGTAARHGAARLQCVCCVLHQSLMSVERRISLPAVTPAPDEHEPSTTTTTAPELPVLTTAMQRFRGHVSEFVCTHHAALLSTLVVLLALLLSLLF